MWWVNEIKSKEYQPQAEISAGDCGGNFVNPNGHLTSPSYKHVYLDDAACIYTISQPNDTYIILTVLQFNLTFDETGNEDYLEIRDGYTKESPLIGILVLYVIGGPKKFQLD